MATSTRQPVFFARVEQKEHAFIAKAPNQVDSLVLLGRFLASPPWEFDQHPHSSLAEANLAGMRARRKDRLLRRPDTWPLAKTEGHEDQQSVGTSRLLKHDLFRKLFREPFAEIGRAPALER